MSLQKAHLIFLQQMPINELLFSILGFDERRGRGDRGNPNLDPEMDIQQNREFYMHNDVRPPYTYAALIRYVRTNYAFISKI